MCSQELTDEDGDDDDIVGLVVQDIEKHDHGLEDVEEDRAHRETLEGLTTPPELHIYTHTHTHTHTQGHVSCCHSCQKRPSPPPPQHVMPRTIFESEELKHAMQDAHGHSEAQQIWVSLQQRGLSQQNNMESTITQRHP